MAWGFVQSTTATGSGATVVATFTTTNCTTQNRIVVGISIGGSGASPTITLSDSGNNPYTQITTQFISTPEFQTWTAPIYGGGGTKIAVTVSQTLTSPIAVVITEYSGLSLSAVGACAVDGSNTGTSSSTVTTGGTQTSFAVGTPSAEPNEVVIGYYGDAGGNATLTAGTGYTMRGSVSGSLSAQVALEDKDNGSAGATPTASVTYGIGVSATATAHVETYHAAPLGYLWSGPINPTSNSGKSVTSLALTSYLAAPSYAVIVLAIQGTTDTTSSISGGPTWTKSYALTGTSPTIIVYTAQVSSPGSITATINMSSSTCTAWLTNFTGINPSAGTPLLGHATGSSTSPASGNLTLSGTAGQTCVQFIAWNGPNTDTLSGGSQFPGTNGVVFNADGQTGTSGGSASSNITMAFWEPQNGNWRGFNLSDVASVSKTLSTSRAWHAGVLSFPIAPYAGVLPSFASPFSPGPKGKGVRGRLFKATPFPFITTPSVQNTQSISGSLSFTGPTNLTKAIGSGKTGTLTFTGPTNLVKAITKGMTGALSFTGKLLRAITLAAKTATLTFTGPTNLVKSVTKGLTAILSFTGPTNLPKAIVSTKTGVLSFTGTQSRAITKGLAATTLTLTGALTKATSKLLAAATLTFTGAITTIRQFNRALTATLTFTGPTNLVNAISKTITGTLSFTGPAHLLNSITKGLAAAALTFTGAITKAITLAAKTATLTFTGAIAASKQFNRALTATLTFTAAQVKQTSKLISGTLSFTGPAHLLNSITKGIAAVLSFTGTQSRAIHTGLSATLTFTGSQVRAIVHGLTAALTFTGPTHLVNAVSKLITGTLSFTGPVHLLNSIGKVMTGALAFTGAIVRKTNHGMAATASFVGSQARAVVKGLVAATLSFSGIQARAVSKGMTATSTFTGTATRATAKGLTGATLSFAGSMVKLTKKVLSAAILAFTGAFTAVKGGSQAFQQALSGTLSFTGRQTKGISKTLSAATLTVAGALVTTYNTIVRAAKVFIVNAFRINR